MVIYDHRVAKVRDAPIRDRQVMLHIRKRRFSCKPCGKPFTEPVPVIRKQARFTECFKRAVLWVCETSFDLKSVRRAFRCFWLHLPSPQHQMQDAAGASHVDEVIQRVSDWLVSKVSGGPREGSPQPER
jgi:hypothetical protein